MPYDFENGELFDMKEEVVPPCKCARRASEALASVILPAVYVVYRNRVSSVKPESVQSDYDLYCGVHCGPSATRKGAGAIGVSSEALLDDELL